MKKSFRKITSIILLVAMIFSNAGFATLADSIDSVVNETTTTATSEAVGASEDVDASEAVGTSIASPKNESITSDDNFDEEENVSSDYEEEPEEETTKLVDAETTKVIEEYKENNSEDIDASKAIGASEDVDASETVGASTASPENESITSDTNFDKEENVSSDYEEEPEDETTKLADAETTKVIEEDKENNSEDIDASEAVDASEDADANETVGASTASPEVETSENADASIASTTTENNLTELSEIVESANEVGNDLLGTTGDTCWYFTGTSPDYTLHLSATENEGYNSATIKGQFRKITSPHDDMPWYSDKEKITSVIIDNNITPLENDMQFWFYFLNNATSFQGLDKIDTSAVTNMYLLFYKCSSVTSLDVGGWDMSHVQNLEGMFAYCMNLTSLDINDWDTSNVQNMKDVFAYCYKLKTLDLSNWNTENVEIMEYPFFHCSDLIALDISNFTTSNATTMYHMFDDCPKLTIIKVDHPFDGSRISEDRNEVFSDCASLIGYNGTGFSEAHRTIDYARLDDPESENPGYFSEFPRVMLYEDATSTKFTECIDLDMTDIGNTISTPSDVPEKTGYKFKGWYKTTDTDDDANLWDFENDTLPGNLILYAGWEELQTYWYLDGESSEYTLHLSSEQNAGYNAADADKKGQFRKFETQDDIGWHEYNEDITKVVIDNEITPLENDMSLWFSGLIYCTEIEGLDNIDTSSVTNMYGMFASSNSFEILDLSNFETSSVTNMERMFINCENLMNIFTSESFVIDSVTSSNYMFDNCPELMGYSGTKYDSSYTDKTYARLDSPEDGHPGYFSTNPRVMLYEATTSTTFTECIDLDITDIGDTISTPSYVPEKTGYKFKGWYKTTDTDDDANKWDFEHDTLPGNLKLYAGWEYAFVYWYLDGTTPNYTLHLSSEKNAGYNAATTKGQFRKFETAEDIGWNEYKENITKVVMDNEIIPLENDMAYWFYGLENVSSITGLDKIDTSRVTDMNQTFYGCYGLTSLDLSSWDTSSVTNMNQIFYWCRGLTSLDLSSWDTSSVTNMAGMFCVCDKLTSLNISNFDTGRVTNMNQMFYVCDKLTSLNISNFDTGRVTDMGWMFSNCSLITSLDLSSFDTSNVTDMNHMFSNCSSLTTIIVSNDFVTTQVTESTSMFETCDKLTGSQGTTIASVSYTTDVTYAKIDGGTASPGLFSESQLPISPVISILEVDGLPNPSGFGDDFYPAGVDFDTLDLSNFRVHVKCEDGSDMWVRYNSDEENFSFSPSPLTAGVIELVITYREKTYTIDCFIYKDTDGHDIIDVVNMPTKTMYVVGDKFDPTGMVLRIRKFNGETVDIAYNDTTKSNFIIPTTALTLDDDSATVKYGLYNPCEIDVLITVLKKAKSFTLNENGIDRYYIAGDTFDEDCLNSLYATIDYGDGTYETINYDVHPEYFTFEPALDTTLTVNHEKITVKLQGATLDYKVVVEPSGNASSIAINTRPSKINYLVGEVFNPLGLVLDVTYPGGIIKTIPYEEAYTEPNFEFEPNPFVDEPFAYGDDHVVVTYKGATTNLPVTVRKEVRDIDIVTVPKYTFYSVGDTFDPTGLVIHVVYVDGSEEDIEYNDNTADAFTFAPPLGKVFEKSDVGASVAVAFANSPSITIEGVERIRNDSLTVISYNPSDDSIGVAHDLNTNRDSYKAELTSAIEKGAIGFYEIEANGVNDAFKKYDHYAIKTLTKEEALAKFDTYTVGDKLFIGAVLQTAVVNITIPGDTKVKRTYVEGDKFNPAGLSLNVTYENGAKETIKYEEHKNDFAFKPTLTTSLSTKNKKIDITYGGKTISLGITVNPKYNPEPYNPGGGGGSSGGSSSDPTQGPLGDLTKNPLYQQLNQVNNIPLSELSNNPLIINLLKSFPENVNAAKTNVKDVSGHIGFGQWQRVPETTMWFFLSGNSTTETTGLLTNGWFNLGWAGQNDWYHFDNNGAMQIGWYQDVDGKIYFLENNHGDTWYGKAVTGQKVIDGITYTFDSNGALIR